MWIVALVLLVAFVVWFAIEPRVIWPGFLLVFSLGAFAAQVLLWVTELPDVQVLHTAVDIALAATGLVLVSFPLLAGLFLVVNCVVMWRKEGLGRGTMISGVVGSGTLGYLALGTVAVPLGWTTVEIVLALLAPPMVELAFGFVCFVLYSSLYTWWFSCFGGTVEAVVVLGGALRGGRTVSPLLARRIDRGLVVARRAWADGRAIPVVMSGGQGSDEQVSEAEAMGAYAVEQGTDRALVRLEDRSTNTEENLRYSAALLRAEGVRGPVAVATNDYHAFRAATMMRRAKLPGYAVGYRTVRYYWPSAMIREYVALLRDHPRFVTVMLGLGCLPMLLVAVQTLAQLG
ncbi:YdcF family protein [uncultured Tessaracoccus sp.]|uniref:YdcF family protein n=1 Tax=uncultured Tessaracoccus sp. TaxID=905023 RepID=UPI0025F9ABB3|nr:YdcF family protein [uncultured Tessaracoccus sp.]